MNLIPFLKAPVLIIESLYDAWSIQNIIVTKCLGTRDPKTLEHCNDTEMAAIKDYHQ